MKAVVMERYGTPEVLQLRDVATPTPKADEVLVRVHAASVHDWDNGVRILQPAIADLMDHAPDANLSQRIAAAAESVEGVQAIEKLRVRKVGINYYVDIHVHSAPQISLYEAQVLSGKVKSATGEGVPAVLGVIVHIEPFEERRSAANVEGRAGNR